MNTTSAEPGRAYVAVGPIDWAKLFLRGVGQVMFQENALTGFLFLVGIAAAVVEEDPRFAVLMALGGLIGTVLGTVTAWHSGYERDEHRAGIYGFNGTLVGIAMSFSFQRPSWRSCSCSWALLALPS
jgi:urea transporter